jgi:hypothetical protein
MALATNAITTYSNSKSIREDLSDYVYNIAPTATPFLTNIKKGSVSSTKFDWQTDTIAAASASGQALQGDTSRQIDSSSDTHRVENYTEIQRRDISVSGTEMKVKKAGIKDMMAYQIALRTKEIKRNMESALTSDNVVVVGNATTAPVSAALGSWIITNFYSVAGSAGTAPSMSSSSDGYPQTAASDGSTPVAFTETHLKTMIQNVYKQGGEIEGSMVMVGPHNKTVVSTFDGIATRFRDVPASKQAQIVGAADVYVSDFGTVTIVPNLFQPENRAYLVDKDMASCDYLRPFAVTPLAQLGDAFTRMLVAEYGLRVKNEKAFGTVRGLATA